jgi:hypothetical protein
VILHFDRTAGALQCGPIVLILMGLVVWCAGLAMAAGGNPPAVINEVLYDPAGKDAGLEFVELFNPTGQAVSLAGWRLESGNGSYPNRWTLEWEGTAADSVPARGFFVIGEEAVVPPPQAVTDLDLQNGPDACRLLPAAGVPDLVGWGDHAYGEYYEARPAPQVTAGASLARDPDGKDSDDNAADFVAAGQPSPGQFNHPACDLCLVRAGRSRYSPWSGAELDFSCAVTNLGSGECGTGAKIYVRMRGVADSSSLDTALPPQGNATAIVRAANPGQGLHHALVWVAYEQDPRPGNDSLHISLVVPPPPVVINEIMFRPAGIECEWLELLNRSAEVLSIGDWTIEDASGKLRVLADGELLIEAGAFLVLVESEEVFRLAHGDVGLSARRPRGGWPTLNDSDGPLGFADHVVLRDNLGTVVDSAAYRENWSQPGVSVERIDPESQSAQASNWSPHCGQGGSPGRKNSVASLVSDTGGLLSLGPQVFSPDGDGRDDVVAASIHVTAESSVRLRVFDVNGRLVRRLVDGDHVEATRITLWDGTADNASPVPVGVYIAVVDARVVATGAVSQARSAVVVWRK